MAFYDGGGFSHPEKDYRISPLGLSETDRDDLVAFPESLTQTNVDCLAGEARVSRPGNF